MGDLGFFGIGEKDYSETPSVRSLLRELFDVRHGEWSRRDASDIDGLSRAAERSGSE
jgi:hypothetical protein